MGGSKKQTVGYWYKLLLHFGWCQGPIDAFLEFRGGDRAAWKGELTRSGQIQIGARELWGGEEKEGGIEGAFDVMLGEADQQPNAYLAAELGPQQSAYRGRASGVFRGGRYGAFNPYPKPASFKLRRILKGWDDDAPWYPETAAITLGRGAEIVRGFRGVAWSLPCLEPLSGGRCRVAASDTDGFALSGDGSDVYTVHLKVYGSVESRQYAGGSVMETGSIMKGGGPTGALATHNIYRLEISNPPQVYFLNHIDASVSERITYTGEPLTIQVANDAVVTLFADSIDGIAIAPSQWMRLDVSAIDGVDFVVGMNAAHMLYDSLVSKKMQGEPVAEVNDANFRDGADQLYDEGFGLCTSYDPAAETIEEFQQRICNVIGGTLGRSPVTGQWYLDLVRGDFALEDLPIITDDDILEWGHEPSTLDDAVSQVVVAWRDPEAKEDRVTAPVQSLGAIQAFGVISETATYREIPTEELALRVAARDLQAKSTPLQRFPLVCKRTIAPELRAGRLFRLQAPRRGVADMVCLAGSMDYGTTRASAIRLGAVQSVFGMPQVVCVAPEPGVDTSPSEVPEVAPAQRAFEAPYVELAGNLSAADMAALAPDAGYVALVAARPGAGLNYTLATSPGGADWGHVGQGDWCPNALIVEAADLCATEFTLSGGDRLEWVVIGTAALWGDEIVRVDAIDAQTGAITIGRGCADTVPRRKSPATRIWFYDEWAAGDLTEYVEGETVGAKALTRTGSAILATELAPSSSVTLSARASRPYPPAALSINGAVDPADAWGVLQLSWAHRNRILQADQLVDQQVPSLVPEHGVTYTLRAYLNDEFVTEQAGLTDAFSALEPGGDGRVRLELESIRDGLASWQVQVREFDYTVAPLTRRITTAGSRRITVSGARRRVTSEV